MMRIITGRARGIRLDTLEGEMTRPTTERAKEAIFSRLQFEVEGRRVLDLFAGSGQMGLEALSRGATHAVMVDQSKEAIAIIRKNAEPKTETTLPQRLWSVSSIKPRHNNSSKIGADTTAVKHAHPPNPSADGAFSGSSARSGSSRICDEKSHTTPTSTIVGFNPTTE